ncbi:hypothetical protein [Streptomyces sp. NPDC057854]|uniref:hypothetical protein n=1 Tax=unclassified Streptomyces TaxID=2593676 RepID=UPI0036A65E69
MATKSVAQKLLVRPGSRVWISDPAYLPLVAGLPADADTAAGPGDADVALAFAEDEAAARALLARHADALRQAPVAWIAYPKGNRSDINRDTLWPLAAAFGLRPNAQVAVDDRWSALRFRALRDGEAPFGGGSAAP